MKRRFDPVSSFLSTVSSGSVGYASDVAAGAAPKDVLADVLKAAEVDELADALKLCKDSFEGPYCSLCVANESLGSVYKDVGSSTCRLPGVCGK